ncbi:MAG: sugar phosphate isomerase/epimerase [Acidimicrobiales bacterium]|nr:sugar phosphate isomerase/epimerase [Acidimicrobiales bacterium]
MTLTIAFSNLAWDPANDRKVAAILRDTGIRGIELAPTKIWPELSAATRREATAYRRFWEREGFTITSLQSLLYGRPELTVFGGPEDRAALVAHLDTVMALAATLGAAKLVFGSPANRRRGDLSPSMAMTRAAAVFGELSERAEAHGVCLCLEPNPTDYGCDFITNATEGAELVREVGRDGFGLHLDTGAMTLAGDELSTAIRAVADVLAHFHCSEPGLAPAGTTGRVDHISAARALRSISYAGVVSVEMLPARDRDPLTAVAEAAAFAVETYG